MGAKWLINSFIFISNRLSERHYHVMKWNPLFSSEKLEWKRSITCRAATLRRSKILLSRTNLHFTISFFLHLMRLSFFSISCYWYGFSFFLPSLSDIFPKLFCFEVKSEKQTGFIDCLSDLVVYRFPRSFSILCPFPRKSFSTLFYTHGRMVFEETAQRLFAQKGGFKCSPGFQMFLFCKRKRL